VTTDALSVAGLRSMMWALLRSDSAGGSFGWDLSGDRADRYVEYLILELARQRVLPSPVDRLLMAKLAELRLSLRIYSAHGLAPINLGDLARLYQEACRLYESRHRYREATHSATGRARHA
jgi:hypothetical protein